tara:strand:- start:200 stop:979 length:780 start_codon:yes stop_codon:yes gene_type:complete
MKILSIDLDFISGPAINSYHHTDISFPANEYYMHGDVNPVIKWRRILDNYPAIAESSYKINIKNYQFCLRTFLRALENCQDVHFGYDHDNILYGLEGHTDIEVINIDHHSDLLCGAMGSIAEEKDIVEHDIVSEGNWGYLLQSQGRLKSFTWILNPTSEEWNDTIVGKEQINNFKYDTIDSYKFEDYNFDQIFVCLSPGYVPPYHWHMFGTFLTLYEEKTGNVIDIKKLHRKYEYKKYYQGVTNYITEGTHIGKKKDIY